MLIQGALSESNHGSICQLLVVCSPGTESSQVDSPPRLLSPPTSVVIRSTFTFYLTKLMETSLQKGAGLGSWLVLSEAGRAQDRRVG